MSRPPLSGCFEPAAEDALRAEPELDTAEVTSISIAISLKRIADAAEALGAGGQSGLENLAWNLGHNLGAGFEHGRKHS